MAFTTVEQYFALQCTDPYNGTRVIDIPGGNCQQGVELMAYPQLHGGNNQLWRWEGRHIVSSLSSDFRLAVHGIRDGAVLFLCNKDVNTKVLNMFDTWVFVNGRLKPENQPEFHLGFVNDKIILRRVDPNHVSPKWEMVATAVTTNSTTVTKRPATSCHLQYQTVPPQLLANSWTLENTVRVSSSANSTYFCVVGWGPGGYSGIQQITETQKVAIFSMWNDGGNCVRCVEQGPGVDVKPFGGEGSGMKALKAVPWQLHQPVTFRVCGVRYDTAEQVTVWRCACWYSIEGSDWLFMAAFERSGNHPFDRFYSFVEDWDRQNNCEGHSLQRSAEFFNTKVFMGNGDVIPVREAVFTKQTEGDDSFANNKAFGAVKHSTTRSFLLTTGGGNDREIVRTLVAQGCQQMCNTSLSKLCV